MGTAVLGLVMFAGDYGCLFWAEKEVPSGLAAVIAATIPVWVLLAEWLFAGAQRPTAKALAGIVLGIAGVIMLMLPAGLHNASFSLSALVLLLGCFFWVGRNGCQPPPPFAAATQHERRPADGLGRQLPPPALGRDGRAGHVACVFPSNGTGSWRSPWAISSCLPPSLLSAPMSGSSRGIPITRVASYAYVNPLVALLLGSLAGARAAHARCSTREPRWWWPGWRPPLPESVLHRVNLREKVA